MGKVTLDLDKMDGIAGRAAENGLRQALGKAESLLKGDILSRPGTGRVYGTHRASAPGEPPAPDTGNLRANTNADPDLKEDGDDLTGRILANAGYAEALERGTDKMAARPYLGLLQTEHADDLNRAFVEGARSDG